MENFGEFIEKRLETELEKLYAEYSSTKEEKEKMREELAMIVEDGIQDIFKCVVKKYDLKSGDFSPEEEGELAVVEDNLVDILVNYAEGNQDE